MMYIHTYITLVFIYVHESTELYNQPTSSQFAVPLIFRFSLSPLHLAPQVPKSSSGWASLRACVLACLRACQPTSQTNKRNTRPHTRQRQRQCRRAPARFRFDHPRHRGADEEAARVGKHVQAECQSQAVGGAEFLGTVEGEVRGGE